MKTSRQHALTVIVPIKSGQQHLDALRDLFEQIVHTDIQDEKDPPEAIVPFKLLTTIHFARWAILPGDPEDTAIPDSLLFSSNFDGPLDAHLRELVDVAATGLDRIYEHCIGYPADRTAQSRIEYLKANRSSYGLAFYVGTPGRTVRQVNQEETLRNTIERFVDDSRDELVKRTPREIREAIQKFVFGDDHLQQHIQNTTQASTLKDVLEYPPPPWITGPERVLRSILEFITGRTKPQLVLTGLMLVLVVVLGFLILCGVLPGPRLLAWFSVAVLIVLLMAALWYIVLRRNEKRDKQADFSARDVRHEDLIRIEDRVVQNQMTSVTSIKPGFFRLFTLRLVLWAVGFLGRRMYSRGKLGTIPTIHFARWVIIDNKKRLLFLSNFDGSWENYLGDFIDKAADGLTAIWSNTQRGGWTTTDDPDTPRGFPDTRNLVERGARDEQRFKAYSRDSQLPTNVWYSARKKLSVQNVNSNSKLRAGLYGRMSDAEIREWLRLI